jgi:hypothetical protein
MAFGVDKNAIIVPEDVLKFSFRYFAGHVGGTRERFEVEWSDN